MRKFILLLLFLINCSCLFAQNRADSLVAALEKSPQDSTRALTLIELCRVYQGSDISKVKEYATQCIAVSDRCGFTKGSAGGHICLGLGLMYEGSNPEALSEFNIAYELYSSINLKRGMANCLNNSALIYSSTGQYDLALDCQLKAIELYRADGNKRMEGNSLNNIALIYINQVRYEDAFPYLLQSIKVLKESGEELELRNPYNNLGLVYQGRKDYDSSNYYFSLAIDLYLKAEDNYNLAGCYNNLALNYDDLNDSTNALLYNRKALELRIENNDQPGIATSWLNIGFIYLKWHAPGKARNYLIKSIQVADSLKMYKVLMNGYIQHAIMDSSFGNLDSAYHYLKLALTASDSLHNEEIANRLADMQVKYDTDEIKKQNLIKDEQLQKEKTIRWLIIGIALLAFVGLVLITIALRAVRKRNKLLDSQRQEILKKNIALNEKNTIISHQKREITDSIDYANTIQKALLPETKEVSELLPESFILYKPRDVISGDFYYVIKTSGAIVFTVADCTGHGVPGALMSMLGVEEFQKAVQVSNNPGKILQLMNASIRDLLKQSEEAGQSRDGMDIAICTLKGNQLEFAGANRPLWICRKGELLEYKPTKMAVGGITPYEQRFETHQLTLQNDDMIYLSSDGFADQFGGPDGKKFMTRNLKNLLCKFSTENTLKQQSALLQHFNEWKGSMDQVDDVTLMGVRIKNNE